MKSLPILILTLAGLLAACAGSVSDQQTLVAYSEIQETQIADLQTTATVHAERLMITVEYAETEIARVGTQQGLMLSTLAARGVDTSVLPLVGTLPPVPAALPTPAGNFGNQPPISQPQVDTSSVQVTPFTLTPAPELELAGQSGLTNIVMARGVDNNDCPMNITNQFTQSDQQIYIVAQAREIANGTTILTRWLRGGEELANFSHTYNFIEDACIWFYADQTDFEFTPGSYSVIMEMGGVPVGQPLPFTIAGTADNMGDG